jgi:hypothetical protein
MTQIKLCKDCKYCSPAINDEQMLFAKCIYPFDPPRLDLVSGKKRNVSCIFERTIDLKEHCGKSGRFFRSKES